MSQIVLGRITYTDTMDRIHKIKKGVECCGSSLKMRMHIDADNYWQSSYVCKCCNVIDVYAERDTEMF